MSGRSPGVKGGPGPPAGGSRCLFILQRCLAIQLQKVALLSEQRKPAKGREEPEYWMYDSGYLLFQVRRSSARIFTRGGGRRDLPVPQTAAD
jgi:hypothetical protein